MSLRWDRLIEGSDSIGRLAEKVVAYRDTAAGFAVAAVHIAALRQAGIPYSCRPRRDGQYPFGVFVAHKQIRRAKRTVGLAGLGVDAAE
jgi:hypothetical protein